MAYQATVYRVLIASPGDVERERDAVEAAIHAWNDEHSMDRGVVSHPVRWERASPRQGASGQDVINKDLVATCDVLIGVFWTRLGSPTANDRSGTVEEIRRFAQSNRPAAIFFKSGNMPMSHDAEQYRLLREFEAEVRTPTSDFRGLARHFRTTPKLRDAVGPYLTNTLRGLPLEAVVTAVEEASARSGVPIVPASEKDFEDEPGLIEVLPVVQDAISEIWARLTALDEVGNMFRVGPPANDTEPSASQMSPLKTANAIFSRTAAWLIEGAAGIEAQLAGMQDSWARLKAEDALFDRLLPFETPEDRQRARDLLTTVPGLQDHFPGMVIDLTRARAGLETYKGKSAELNGAVRHCDRALGGAIATITQGQAVAKHLAAVLTNRFQRFDDAVLLAAVRVALRSGEVLISTRDLETDPDIAGRSDPEIRQSLEMLSRRGLIATVIDQGDAGIHLRLIPAGLDYALPTLVPTFGEQVERIRRAICDLKETTLGELTHTGLSRLVIEYIALNFERQGLVRVRRDAENNLKIDSPAPALCK